MPIDPEMLRQILGERASKMMPDSPQMDQEMPMEAPPEGMAMEALMGEGAPMGMDPEMPPAVLMEMERQKVKDMLKQVRMKEAAEEADAIYNARMQDIGNEVGSLFSPKKKASY